MSLGLHDDKNVKEIVFGGTTEAITKSSMIGLTIAGAISQDIRNRVTP